MKDLKSILAKKPKTVKEAVNILLKILTEKDKSFILKHPNSLDYHMSLGMWIRNQFGLWDNNEDLLMDCQGTKDKENLFIHPDTASSVILEELISKLKKTK